MRRLSQVFLVIFIAVGVATAQDLWQLARQNRSVHRFSTVFAAQDVRDHLSSDEGIANAIAWCKQFGITKVYLGTYKGGYQAERDPLVRARDRFGAAGFVVSGLVTTTQIGKGSTGWSPISCYTNQGSQTQLRSIFEFTAGIFDEILVDDFWFTDCTCEECDTARKDRQVRIRVKTFPVPSAGWEDYRLELMFQLSRSHVIGAAKGVNPNARVIVKYPQWYDRWKERGYDLARQSRLFDALWSGTESRDRSSTNVVMQYRSYFLMRWFLDVAGRKTNGGWFDSSDTTEKTYVEQARQTVLGGARETVLASYGELQQNFGPEDLAALRPHIPELFEVAAEVGKRTPVGVAGYRPTEADPGNEEYIFDYVGMLGVPLAPEHEFPADDKAMFASLHAASLPDFPTKLAAYVATGRPVLVTDGLARRIASKVNLGSDNVQVLAVGGKPLALLDLPQQRLDDLRAPLLEPFGTTFRAPAEVALYLFSDGSWAIENFRNEQTTVELNGQSMMVGAREWVYHWTN